MTILSHGLQLEMSMATDIGQVRSRNEDEIRILPERGIAILADGMGGHQAGDVAARTAVETVAEELRQLEIVSDDSLIQSIKTANKAIRTMASKEPACRGMGSTIVVTSFYEDKVSYAHVGDSRLYAYWDNKLQQLTEDHTLAQQYVNDGLLSVEDSKNWTGRNLLIKALGIEEDAKPNLGYRELHPGQTYLLCSDGLTDPLSDEQIKEVLAEDSLSTDKIAEELVHLANQGGGPDNVSVAVVVIGTQN